MALLFKCLIDVTHPRFRPQFQFLSFIPAQTVEIRSCRGSKRAGMFAPHRTNERHHEEATPAICATSNVKLGMAIFGRRRGDRDGTRAGVRGVSCSRSVYDMAKGWSKRGLLALSPSPLTCTRRTYAGTLPTYTILYHTVSAVRAEVWLNKGVGIVASRLYSPSLPPPLSCSAHSWLASS
jgi:hypothetical protein